MHDETKSKIVRKRHHCNSFIPAQRLLWYATSFNRWHGTAMVCITGYRQKHEHKGPSVLLRAFLKRLVCLTSIANVYRMVGGH